MHIYLNNPSVMLKPDKKYECAVPKRICCSIECESNTSVREFFWDFAKLVNVKSLIKIYLAGINQKTFNGATEYQQKRLEQAQKYISVSEDGAEDTDWYIAFWPSPKSEAGESRSNQDKSMWNFFHKYPHLNSIYLYRLVDGIFLKR